MGPREEGRKIDFALMRALSGGAAYLVDAGPSKVLAPVPTLIVRISFVPTSLRRVGDEYVCGFSPVSMVAARACLLGE